jgi:hypothetical protein
MNLSKNAFLLFISICPLAILYAITVTNDSDVPLLIVITSQKRFLGKEINARSEHPLPAHESIDFGISGNSPELTIKAAELEKCLCIRNFPLGATKDTYKPGVSEKVPDVHMLYSDYIHPENPERSFDLATYSDAPSWIIEQDFK